MLQTIGRGMSPFGLADANASNPPFSPINIADSILWLDASDTGSITQVAGSVSQIDDKSSGNNNITQSTASLQMTTDARTIGGLNALDGDGSQYMELSSFAVGTSITILIVAEVDTATQNNQSLLSFDAANDFQLEALSTSGDFYSHFRSTNIGVGNLGNTIAARNGPAIYGIRLNASTGGAELFYGNITPFASNLAYNGNLSVSQQLKLFASRDGSRRIDGAFGELLIYNRALSDSEINQIGTYLQNKWGTSWTTN